MPVFLDDFDLGYAGRLVNYAGKSFTTLATDLRHVRNVGGAAGRRAGYAAQNSPIVQRIGGNFGGKFERMGIPVTPPNPGTLTARDDPL